VERQDDPVLRNARREAKVILALWALTTLYCCAFCYAEGYLRPDRPLGLEDLHPVLGIPRWFFWGVVAPWAVCGVVTLIYAGFLMADDDLGEDRAAELDADIREGAAADG
jgi:hypothetical protein